MRATRHLIAVVAVTTALCADQVAVAAPVDRPQVSTIAGRLATRLTQSLRRTVATVMPCQARQPAAVTPAPAAMPRAVTAPISHRPVSPFEFRLPPPLIG